MYAWNPQVSIGFLFLITLRMTLLSQSADTIKDEDVKKLIHNKAKDKTDEILESIKGYLIESDQRTKLNLARAHLEYLDAMIVQTQEDLYERIQPYWDYVQIISSLPGVTELSAAIILAETGVNMDVFEDADHLASWCGLTPRANESAGKKHSTSIMKAGAYLKPLLVQCALAAVKSKKKSYFAIKYNRLARRRGKKRAIPLCYGQDSRYAQRKAKIEISQRSFFSSCDSKVTINNQ